MIDQIVLIPHATPAEVYATLLDSEKHTELIGDTTEIDPVIDGEFSAFSGYATGKTLQLIPNKTIKQAWRASDWPDNHFSTITFSFTAKDDGTEIHFTQVDLPEGTQEEFEAGWEDNYWQPLRNYFDN